jgi:hypothetical protein
MADAKPDVDLTYYFNDSKEIPGNGKVDQWFCLVSGGCDQPQTNNTNKDWEDKGWEIVNPEPLASWGETLQSSQDQRYTALEFAKIFDIESAYQAISMGGPQIMGQSHGFLPSVSDATDMYTKFSSNEIYQVIGFFEFMENKSSGGHPVIWYAQNHQFSGLAIGYNGSSSYKDRLCTGYVTATQLFNAPMTGC